MHHAPGARPPASSLAMCTGMLPRCVLRRTPVTCLASVRRPWKAPECYADGGAAAPRSRLARAHAACSAPGLRSLRSLGGDVDSASSVLHWQATQ